MKAFSAPAKTLSGGLIWYFSSSKLLLGRNGLRGRSGWWWWEGGGAREDGCGRDGGKGVFRGMGRGRGERWEGEEVIYLDLKPDYNLETMLGAGGSSSSSYNYPAWPDL